METKHRFELWRLGEPLGRQSKLNQAIPFLNRIAPLLPARESSDPGNSGDAGADEVWSFIEADTETTIIADKDNPETFVTVEITNSVTVERPDGRQIKIELRLPSG